MKGDTKYDDDTPEDIDNSKAEARAQCKENGGTYVLGKCWGGNKNGNENGEDPTTPSDNANTPSLGFENKGLSTKDAKDLESQVNNIGKKFNSNDFKTGDFALDSKAFQAKLASSTQSSQQATPSSQSGTTADTPTLNLNTSISKPQTQLGGSATSSFGKSIGTRK